VEPQSANALRFYVGILPKPGDGRLVMFNVTQCPNDAACLVLRANASGVSGPKSALFSGFPRGRDFYAFGSRLQVLDNAGYKSCAVEVRTRRDLPNPAELLVKRYRTGITGGARQNWLLSPTGLCAKLVFLGLPSSNMRRSLALIRAFRIFLSSELVSKVISRLHCGQFA
jgi:hypothetical protein